MFYCDPHFFFWGEESWPWCGIPCGLGHCEGLSGGNQQLPRKAAKFASRLVSWHSCRSASSFEMLKIFDRLAADPEKMGLLLDFISSLKGWFLDVFGSNTKTIEQF